MISIARDVEELCPEALLINYTNPESRVCLGISLLTKAKTVGLCHGVAATLREITGVLDGKDPMGEFREHMKTKAERFDALTRKYYELFGYLTYPAPSHPGEYVAFAHDLVGPVFTLWGIGGVSRSPKDTDEGKNYTVEGKTGRASYERHSRKVLLQALAIEPCIDSVTREEDMMDHMLRIQADYLPRLS